MKTYKVSELRTLKLGTLVSELIDIGSDKERAKRFFDAYVECVRWNVPGLTAESARERAAADIGYSAGYAPKEIDVKMWSELGASHPVFGSVLQ